MTAYNGVMIRFSMTRFRPLASRLLDMILPPRCPMTGDLVAENGTISPRYWQALHFIHSPLCTCCGAPFATAIDTDMTCGKCLRQPPLYDRLRAVFLYNDMSARMILKFKHADGIHLAPLFARWMQQSGAELLAQSDMIIPVPLHRWRMMKRRYNQAAILAQLLGKAQKIPCETMALKRIRHTPSQGTKNTEQRFANMEAAFTVPEKHRPTIKDKNILLIDDVYTSGATIQHCTQALLHGGAKSVSVLTLARTGYAQ